MEKEQIARINELARKKKTVGLTEGELREQEALRRQYITEFRESVRSTLDNVYLQQEDGSYKKLEKKPPLN